MTGDIVVILRGGTYSISEPVVFDQRDSATGGHTIIYRSADGQKADRSAAAGPSPAGSPTPTGAGRPPPPDNFRQLYVDGGRAVRARGDALPGAELHGEDGYTDHGRRDGRLEEPGRHRVLLLRRLVPHAVQGPEHPARGRPGGHHHAPAALHPRPGEGGRPGRHCPSYIENALELLDEPGEWYLDRAAKTVYYMPRPGEDMTKVGVVAPAVERLVELRGTLDQPVENIHFEGITFAEAGWLVPSEIGLVDVQANFRVELARPAAVANGGITAVHNEHIKSPANVVCHAAKSIRFERCTFTRLGGAGIDVEFGSQDNVVSGCRFHDISGTAVQVGDVLKDDHHPDDPRKIVKNNAVVNNYIHDCCVEYMGGVGVFAGYTDGTVIAHNEICRLPYSGISVGWGWGEEDAGGGNPSYYSPSSTTRPRPRATTASSTTTSTRDEPLQDGGGIYTLGNMPGTVIRGNHIHDNPRRARRDLPGRGQRVHRDHRQRWSTTSARR